MSVRQEILLIGGLSGWTNQSTPWCWLTLLDKNKQTLHASVKLLYHIIFTYNYLRPCSNQFHMKFHEHFNPLPFSHHPLQQKNLQPPEKFSSETFPARSSNASLWAPKWEMWSDSMYLVCSVTCCIPIVYSPFFVFVVIFFLHLFTAVDYYNPLKLTNVYKCYIILLATARVKIYSFYIDLLSREHDTSEYPPTGCRFLQVLNPTSDSYEFNWMLEEVGKDVAPQPGAMPFRCLTKYLDVWIPPRWHGQLDGRCGSLCGRFRFWRRLNWGRHCRPIFFELRKTLAGNAFAKILHGELWLLDVKSTRVRQGSDGVNVLGSLEEIAHLSISVLSLYWILSHTKRPHPEPWGDGFLLRLKIHDS